MHYYVSTRIDRIRVTATLAVISTAIFLLFGATLKAASVTIPYWISSPGVLAVFTGVFLLYDRVLWRIRVLGLPFSPLPDMNGYWEGHVTIEGGEIRNEEKGADKIPCQVTVEQTWSRMLIQFETQFTKSDSLSATVVGPQEALQGLRYEYRVRPKLERGYGEQMPEHSGFARLEPSPGWDDLRGDFYNDRHYRRFGQYAMKRVRERPKKAPWEH